ncbi:KAR-UP F-box 1 [Perilla frutescens var. frutescens]|nr:KAR-UP F-box 1 [Perilla frutescens var. frutescens]
MSNPISTTTLELEATTAATKKPKHHHPTEEHCHESLLPGIPDHLSQLCLSLVPPSKLYSVCRSWRRLIYSPSFPPFFSLYALFLPAQNYHNHHLSNTVEFNSFDPISSKWQPLPPPPPHWPLRFLYRHPSFISRKLPIQSVAVSGKLVVLAATNDDFLPALSQPLVFDSLSRKWALGPQLISPRRWCAAGASHGDVYVASGIGSHYNTDVARSVEKWNINCHRNQPPRLRRWTWQKMGNLKDGKFSRDAIDAVGWRGKLCMVNVKGDAAKEGIIYDIEKDCWEEMPEGMLAGWRGPAAAMDEETIYVVDESKGLLKKYDHVRDAWEEMVEDTRLKGALQMAAAGGKVCVSAADGGSIVVVDVVAPPPARLWVVDVPLGFQVLAVHILPRLSHTGIDSE